jgi:hypothetical protein
MRFDVPFVPDPDYVALLAANRGRLASVHFRLSPERPRTAGCPAAATPRPRISAKACPPCRELPAWACSTPGFHDPSLLSARVCAT